MGLFENCNSLFGANNLYEVLSVEKTASDAELKKAYRKVSLIVHPDRVEPSQKDEATRKFQTLSQVYLILSDNEKRVAYDETGCIDEENASTEDRDWCDYWRTVFPRITLKDIEDFYLKYKGSEEETEDLKKCYEKFKGDMNQISVHLLGFTIDEEDRYREILNNLIKSKTIPGYSKFTKESAAKRNARIKRFTKEAAEAEEVMRESGVPDDSLLNALANRSRDRERQFDEMIKNMELKYGNNSNKKKRKQ